MAETITQADAEYALDLVRTICAEVGPGAPGSPQERARAGIFGRELAAHLGAENVAFEEFTLAPDAFLGNQLLCTILMALAVLLNRATGAATGAVETTDVMTTDIVTAAIAVALSALAVALFILEFVYGYEVVDPLFKTGRSVNVIGSLRKPGAGRVTRLLLLSGHHDSAREFTWLRFTGYGYFFLTVTWVLALLTALALNVLLLAGALTGSAGLLAAGTPGPVALAYPILPAVIYAVFFLRGRRGAGTVPGAVDNLSGSAVAVAMCRFLAAHPDRIPDETEIRFISFGGEEAGCRGSRRYVARHRAELRRLDARLLNFEMVAHPEIIILTTETNGVVKNSPEMVRSVVAAAERAGVPHKTQPAFIGIANDAGRFSRAGIKATTLLPFKAPQQMVAFYHQDRDTPDRLTVEPLLNTLKLTDEWLRARGA